MQRNRTLSTLVKTPICKSGTPSHDVTRFVDAPTGGTFRQQRQVPVKHIPLCLAVLSRFHGDDLVNIHRDGSLHLHSGVPDTVPCMNLEVHSSLASVAG